MATFDVEAAKNAGYSDQEIQSFLEQNKHITPSTQSTIPDSLKNSPLGKSISAIGLGKKATVPSGLTVNPETGKLMSGGEPATSAPSMAPDTSPASNILKSSASSIYEGGQQMGEVIGETAYPGSYPSEDNFSKFAGGAAKAVTGAAIPVLAAANPVGAAVGLGVAELPGAKDVLEGVQNKFADKEGDSLYNGFINVLGIDPDSEAGQASWELFNALGQLSVAKFMESAATKGGVVNTSAIPLVESVKSTVNKVPDLVKTAGTNVKEAVVSGAEKFGTAAEAIRDKITEPSAPKAPKESLIEKAKSILAGPEKLTPEGTPKIKEVNESAFLTPTEIAEIAKRESPVKEIDVTPVVKEALRIGKDYERSANQEYEAGMKAIIEKYGDTKFTQTLSGIKSSITESLKDEFRIVKKPISQGKGLDFDASPMEASAQSLVQKMIDIIKNTKDTTAEGLNTMRQKLSPFVGDAQSMEGQVKAVAKTIYDKVRYGIGKDIPEVRQLNERHTATMKPYNDVEDYINPKKSSQGGKEMALESKYKALSGKGKITAKDLLQKFEEVAHGRSVSDESGVVRTIEAKGKIVNPVMEEARAVEASKVAQRFTKEEISEAAKEVNMTAEEFNAQLQKAFEGDKTALQRMVELLVQHKGKTIKGIVSYLLLQYAIDSVLGGQKEE